MDKEAIDLLIAERPLLASSRPKLEEMQPGRYCIHHSWGFGQIKSYDDKDNRLIIDFEDDKTGHPMDPVFCINKLQVLSSEHILARYKDTPKAIEALIKKQPIDLIIEILKCCPDQSSSTIDIEAILKRIMLPSHYRKWWLATKKLLTKDPRVAVPSKKSGPYVLRETPLRAEDEILEEFFEIIAPKKQIVLAEKLLELSLSDDDVRNQLPDILDILTTALAQTRLLTQGERLHGLWVRNDLARFIHGDIDKLSPTSASIFEEVTDISALAEQIPPSYHQRLLDLLKRAYPDRWEKIALSLLRNSSGRLTTECINFLIEQSSDKFLKESLKKWLDEQALKGPLLYWVVRNRSSRKYSKLLHDLISPRLFKAILYAIDYEALQNAATRRMPLADILSSDQELIPELLAEATPETANDLAITLILNQGFEDLTKKSLLARFIRQFPNVQNVISGNQETQPDVSDHLIVSQSSLNLLKDEYEELVMRKLPENKKAIAQARELGDLRENSEYKMARQEQDILLARKSQLEQDTERARVTDFSDAPTETVGIGSAVELKIGSTSQIVTYYILGAWDSDPEANILSYKTPLGQSLISQKVGSTVNTVIDDSTETWTIRSISRWIEQQGVSL